MEEKTNALDRALYKASPVINEITRIISEFSLVNNLSERDRNQYFKSKKRKFVRQLRISFHDDTEITQLKTNTTYKSNVRNILGLRHSDDWIYSLNIGNVMHLSPMNTDELTYKLDRSHEINKDAMLEKIILLIVSFFCVGTELRFLS